MKLLLISFKLFNNRFMNENRTIDLNHLYQSILALFLSPFKVILKRDLHNDLYRFILTLSINYIPFLYASTRLLSLRITEITITYSI